MVPPRGVEQVWGDHMQETLEDCEKLQGLLDESIQKAGDFLRTAFQMPELSLSAAQLVDALRGSVTVALASTTAKGELRLAPINALFYRGAFTFPLSPTPHGPGTSARDRLSA